MNTRLWLYCSLAVLTPAAVNAQDFTGRIEAIARVEVKSRVTGSLEKVLFKDGAEVKKGDVLFEIDSRSCQADLDRARAEVRRAETRLRRFTADAERIKKLHASGTAGQDELNRIVAERDEAEASVQVARAALEMAQLHLSFTRVTAPLSGRVGRRCLDPGSLVKADETPLVEIVATDPVAVIFEVDERTAVKLRRNQQANSLTTTVGTADKHGFSHQGTIDFIDTQVDPKTGTLRMRAIVPNKDGVLLPGMFARVRLIPQQDR